MAPGRIVIDWIEKMQISETILEELWDFWCWNYKHVQYSSSSFHSLSHMMLNAAVQQLTLTQIPMSVFLLPVGFDVNFILNFWVLL